MSENKLDGEWEFSLVSCGNTIAAWKKSYCRKNSKKSVKISLRCWHTPPDPVFWKYYLECYRDGKMIHQDRICVEAYDVLARDMPVNTYSGIDFVLLETFTPKVV